jgi:hypothetical protein
MPIANYPGVSSPGTILCDTYQRQARVVNRVWDRFQQSEASKEFNSFALLDSSLLARFADSFTRGAGTATPAPLL